ncbi:hypothetical protein VMCG_04707 [Cytospora schulzeri]|uniref:Uncharacterized protein n=1 Tax=Cytospora schulzeri TaxID=448051 RepID=A0A423WSB7_9PEZI|nr:hypothetical protein VMCG_04707 [Valsa malicola]
MSRNLSIKGKKGERVAVSDCNIEPLNMFIPGGGPILVPKHKAWPGQKKKKTTITVEVPLDDEDYYDAEEEEDELEERPAAEVKCKKVSQAARANSQKNNKGKISSSKNVTKKSNNAEIERRSHRKLMQRIKEQEEYIAQLKAEYESKKDEAKAYDETESDADTDTDDAITTDDDGTQTSEDDSNDAEANEARKKVRAMLKAIRIKAAGTNGEVEGFTASEDAQILARKEAGESFKIMAGFMRRSKKQIAKRYDELVKAGKTAGTGGPGEGATTDAATAGETTDAEKTTDAENDAQVTEGDFGGLFDLGGLTNALEAVAAEQAETEKKKKKKGSPAKKKDSPPKKSDKTNKKDKDKQNKPPHTGMPKGGNKKPSPKATAAEANAGGESGYEGGPEAIPDNVGTQLYINQYARHLLQDQDKIPEADDKFDQEDCILLALTESQLEHGRWEEIQARFANLTGRMVPVEVLKYKLGGARKPDYY